MRPKLVALDLDGTLLTSDKDITARTERTVKTLMRQGVRVVLCTGRPPRLVRRYATQLGLTGPTVVYQGASLYDFGRELPTHLYQLDRTVSLEVIRVMRNRFPDVLAGVEATTGWYLDQKLFELRNGQRPDGVGDVETFVQEGVIKLLFRHPSMIASTMSRALAELPVYTTWTSDNLLEVLHPLANKSRALELLSKTLDVKQDEIAAFGDQHNDAEMLSWVGFGVAMANASEEAKAAADSLTSSNDDEGVARFLERWITPEGAGVV
ncbi:MAG: HAD family phosphatase [Trueperaceae bacterium]|nr:MAG: HAD family phosphatase [Trueperaceae bacterium]